MLIIPIAIGLALFALAIAIETAFQASTAVRLEIATPQSGFRGRAVRHFAHHPGHLDATLFVLKAIGVSSFGVGGGLLLVANVVLLLDALHPAVSAFFAVILSTGVLAIALGAIGTLLPRIIALKKPEAAVLSLCPLVRIASYFVPRRQESAIWPWTLPTPMPESTVDEGDTFLENVVDMATTRVKDSMVPRTDIEAVEESDSIDEVRRRFVESGYSKLPVTRGNLDRVVGIAFAHDLFDMPATLSEITRTVRFVPETKSSRDLLNEFLATSTSVAVVIDEYGGTAGMVTREDLLEELFGEIDDEFDSDDFIAEQHPDGSLIVSGRTDLATLEDRFGIALQEGEYESLGGYLLERIGSIPPVGTELVEDGHRFLVVRAIANRIDLVRISPETSGSRETQAGERTA